MQITTRSILAGLIAAAFFGLKAAVLAIVIEAVMRVGKRALANNILVGVAAAAFVAIFFFAIPFPFIILGAALLGFLATRLGSTAFQGKGHGPSAKSGAGAEPPGLLGETLPAHTQPSLSKTLSVSAVWLALWLVPVGAVIIMMGLVVGFVAIALVSAMYGIFRSANV